MRIVPIECVRYGSYLGKTIYDNEGRILLKAGALLSDKIIQCIKALDIYSLYIVDQYSENEIEDIIKPELRQKSISVLKDTFNNIDRIANSVGGLDATSFSKKDDDYFNTITDISEELLDNILTNKNVLVSLVDIKSLDNYTYQHSVNVAILALVLGISLKLTKHDLLNLCIGALIHDIGKVFIPKEIITKEGPLTFDEYELIKSHPRKGYDYLYNKYSIKTASKLIVLQHHERIDGNGYPSHLEPIKLNMLSKIVSICDVYDALTSDRSYRRALCPSEALEYILANAGTMFDFELVKIFAKIIVPFPSGTIVRLSNGDVGIVQETLPNFPLRPNVKIVKSVDVKKQGCLLKLVDELSVVISNIQYEI